MPSASIAAPLTSSRVPSSSVSKSSSESMGATAWWIVNVAGNNNSNNNNHLIAADLLEDAVIELVKVVAELSRVSECRACVLHTLVHRIDGAAMEVVGEKC